MLLRASAKLPPKCRKRVSAMDKMTIVSVGEDRSSAVRTFICVCESAHDVLTGMERTRERERRQEQRQWPLERWFLRMVLC